MTSPAPLTGHGELRRTLGVRDAAGVGLGAMIGAGVFAAWGPAAGAAGAWLLIALLLAAVIALCNAWSSAALAVRYPQAGGSYVYGTERLGPGWGFLAGWCFVIGKTASCAAMAMTAAAYLAPGWERPAAVAAVVLITVLNLGGVQRSARASGVIALGTILVLAVVVVAAVAAPARNGTAVPAPDVGVYGVVQGAGLLFFAFAGYARIATLAEEVHRPERTIPRAVALALSVVLVVYAVVGVTLLQVLGAGPVAGSLAPVADLGGVGGVPVVVVAVAAGVAALGALLSVLLGISRIAVAMSRDGHLPAPLARIGTARQVPVVADLVVGGVVLGVVLVADLRGAIGFSSFGVLLYYAVANASAWTLSDWRWSRLVPGLGLAGCLLLVLALPWGSVLGGAMVVALGVAWYALSRRR